MIKKKDGNILAQKEKGKIDKLTIPSFIIGFYFSGGVSQHFAGFHSCLLERDCGGSCFGASGLSPWLIIKDYSGIKRDIRWSQVLTLPMYLLK